MAEFRNWVACAGSALGWLLNIRQRDRTSSALLGRALLTPAGCGTTFCQEKPIWRHFGWDFLKQNTSHSSHGDMSALMLMWWPGVSWLLREEGGGGCGQQAWLPADGHCGYLPYMSARESQECNGGRGLPCESNGVTHHTSHQTHQTHLRERRDVTGSGLQTAGEGTLLGWASSQSSLLYRGLSHVDNIKLEKVTTTLEFVILIK